MYPTESDRRPLSLGKTPLQHFDNFYKLIHNQLVLQTYNYNNVVN
jgi:hypothetical protein